jgi:glycosyltransferase involved in cell wall biosynthesis
LKWAYTDARVAISEAAAAAMRAMGLSVQVIPSAVPVVAPNPSRVREFLARENLVRQRLIGTAAALSPEKDPVTLIQAAAQVCAKYPDVTFVHWGADGAAADAARQAIRELGLGERYRLLGFESGVEQLFAALNVFVMASRQEALGSSVLDAMAQQVPVVATQAGGLKELLADERGLLCAPGDARGLAEQIAQLLDDPERGSALAARALHEVRLRYGVDTMVQMYERLYRQVVAAP